MKIPKIPTKTLLKISFIISLTGILLLLFLANFLEPKEISIGEIDNKMLNKKVRIQGEIFRVEDKETFLILSVSDPTGKIDVLCNCKNSIDLNQNILAIGKIKEYKEYLQIQADKIIKVE